MENEILGKVLEKLFEGGGFFWGFISGGMLMLVFRETVVRFLVKKVLKWKNGQNGKK